MSFILESSKYYIIEIGISHKIPTSKASISIISNKTCLGPTSQPVLRFHHPMKPGWRMEFGTFPYFSRSAIVF